MTRKPGLLVIPLLISLSPWISLAFHRSAQNGSGQDVNAATIGALAFAITGPLAAAMLCFGRADLADRLWRIATAYALLSLPIIAFEAVFTWASVMSLLRPWNPVITSIATGRILNGITAICAYLVYFVVVYLAAARKKSWTIITSVLLGVGTAGLMLLRLLASA